MSFWTITVRYSTIDRCSKRRVFKTLVGAQKFARKYVGQHPEISGLGYAVAADGVGKIEVSGATIADLFPPSA